MYYYYFVFLFGGSIKFYGFFSGKLFILDLENIILVSFKNYLVWFCLFSLLSFRTSILCCKKFCISVYYALAFYWNYFSSLSSSSSSTSFSSILSFIRIVTTIYKKNIFYYLPYLFYILLLDFYGLKFSSSCSSTIKLI